MNASEPPRKATTMLTRTFEVRFLTPAFLGNAEQNGQWRTPPFKHLLREWWRVAWVADNDPADWKKMREVEGRLFGHAWLENDRDGQGRKVAGRQSRVRLRLAPWGAGHLRAMPTPRRMSDGCNAVVSHLYLGYGPVKSATELKMVHPLDPGEDAATLALAWLQDAPGAEYMEDMSALIHAFGAVGGRSRNGWGSLWLGENESGLPMPDLARFSRDWQDCLGTEWAHAIGKDDDGPLIWHTQHKKEWKEVVEELARIRKETNALAKREHAREAVNQPVGHKGSRVPNNLRFKVRREEGGRYYGVVFHMPFLPPGVDLGKAERVWPQVHAFFDRHLERGRA